MCSLQSWGRGSARCSYPRLIDELPVLAVAALCPRQTLVMDAQELRVKETDRIAAVAGNLPNWGKKSCLQMMVL